MADMEEHMPTKALSMLADGNGAALATVISTWGSAPRPVGSQLAISEDGTFYGSVSGGCVEGAVIIEAQDAIKDGKCRRLHFGVADEDAFAVGLACGGKIDILIEPINDQAGLSVANLHQLSDAYASRKFAGYKVNTNTWQRTSLDGSPLTARKSKLDGDTYTHVQAPNPRLVIVGAVHIAQHLSKMAKMAGFDVYINDPRESFATEHRFPLQNFIEGWSDEALEAAKLDDYTSVVTLTHDPKIDTPAISTALNSEAFYIGALGSTRTHGKRTEELLAQGFDQDQINRIHGPVGLDIGAQSPAEIAVSILGEIIKTLRQG